MVSSKAPPKGVGTLRRIILGKLPYLVASNVNGSSLPNRSGVPVVLSLSVRAFDRWMASAIISGVAVARGFLVVDEVDVDDVEVVKQPSHLEVDVDVEVV
jgi:hypothetical protein